MDYNLRMKVDTNKHFKNCKHFTIYCQDCGEMVTVAYDEFHGQIICTQCGLVLYEM